MDILILISKSNVKLTNYSNDNIPVVGTCKLNCKVKNQDYCLDFVVVGTDSPALIGLNSCIMLNLIKKIDFISENILVKQYSNVFKGIGCIQGQYNIKLKENAQPVIHAARKIPFPLIDKFKKTLYSLENDKIICKVSYPTEWVNPIVLVVKKDQSLRICLDPSDLNKNIRREHFALPTFDEISAKLSGAKIFSTLDAMSGFWQVELDKNSSDLCTFATPFGRYKFLRLPFGLSCAPEVFHKKFKEIFDLPGVEIYLDDILIWGTTKAQHDERLKNVLEIAMKNNIKFNQNKCKIGLSKIVYMGHEISESGFRADDSKVKAIADMPIPKNKEDLQRFLGMVTYVGKFISHLSTITAPLRELLKKNIAWVWENRHDDAFNVLKQQLIKHPILQFYDPTVPITISADSSKNGVGAVLLQNGLPCMYASKSLCNFQLNWAQIEKELFSLVFACERFHQYIFGKRFTMETDQKALTQLFKKPLYKCPPRLQRMFIRLQRYDINLIYKPGKELIFADTLSRAYLSNDSQTDDCIEDEIETQICLLRYSLNATDEKISEIQFYTAHDKESAILLDYTKNGWPKTYKQVSSLVKIYFKFKNEITEANGLLYKNRKLIVPPSLRKDILDKIHYSHLGIIKCKNLAREYFFWPNISRDIENLISGCLTCRTFEKNKRNEPMLPHELPNLPWEKVACDLFYLDSEVFLLVVDYFSKYIELAKLVDGESSNEVILHLKSIFARHGIPKCVISDGGPQFNCIYFMQFSKSWNFNHTMSSPLYPQSNGLVERHVQTLKDMLYKAKYDNKDLYLTLLSYRNTPIDGNLDSPAQILMNRRLRGILPIEKALFKPVKCENSRVKELLRQRQVMQKQNYDRKCTVQSNKFIRNQPILYKKKLSDKKWQKGYIKNKNQSRPRSFDIKTHNNRVLCRNTKFIKNYPVNYDSSYLDSESVVGSENENEISQNSGLDDDIIFVPTTTRSGRVVNPPQRLRYNT